MRFWVLAFFVVMTVSTSAQDILVVENVNIVSPHVSQVHTAQHVMIVDGRIVDISNESFQTVAAVKRLDGSGQYLVPGIMDSHVHVSSIPGMGFAAEDRAQKHPELVNLYFEQQPKSYLYHGVTQILDPNPGVNWQKFTAAKKRPDFFRCEVITSAETFPYVEMPADTASELFPFLVDEKAGPETPRSPEKLVTEIAQSGARCIKLYFEDGYGNNSQWPLLSKSTTERIKKTAVEKGLLVLAHANALDMYQAAILADVDMITHGMWNWGKERRGNGFPAPIAATLNEMKEKNIGYMPSQRIVSGLEEIMYENILDARDYKNVVPKALLDWYRQGGGEWFKQDVIKGFDGMAPERIAAIFKYGKLVNGQHVMKYLHEAGRDILLGSDSPGSPTFVNQPGLNSYLEMKMLAEAGLPLHDVLAAATLNNARMFKMDQDYGSVEVGKVANLLLLKKNPLDSVEAWNNISTIILHGETLRRDSMKASE